MQKERLPPLLAGIKKRPGMYFGRVSLSLFAAFLDGYSYAAGPEAVEISNYMEGFQEWIAKRYGIKSAHRWNSIILFFELEESAAFDRFFELLEQFREEKKLREERKKRLRKKSTGRSS